jgi:hypothetical protein
MWFILIFGPITPMMLKMVSTNCFPIASYVFCKIGKDGILMKGLFYGHELDMQCFYFKITMVTNSEAIIE